MHLDKYEIAICFKEDAASDINRLRFICYDKEQATEVAHDLRHGLFTVKLTQEVQVDIES